jgi:pyruvyltransferase
MTAADVDNPPLRLFWWQGVPNFGDALSALIVAHVAGRPVEHAGVVNCDMVAIGSLLQVVRRKYGKPRGDGVRPWIWGAGLMRAVNADFLDNVQVALLRGPVTAALLGIRATRFGDPGLLVPSILGDLPVRHDRIGLMVHHSQLDDPALAALIAAEPALELIDVRDDARDVCRRIAACAHVISSSLHGLIVADACNVASTWLDPGSQSHLKYHDYAASVGRVMIAPLALGDVPAYLRGLKDDTGLAHGDGVERAREALTETFPDALRDGVETSGEQAGA